MSNFCGAVLKIPKETLQLSACRSLSVRCEATCSHLHCHSAASAACSPLLRVRGPNVRSGFVLSAAAERLSCFGSSAAALSFCSCWLSCARHPTDCCSSRCSPWPGSCGCAEAAPTLRRGEARRRTERPEEDSNATQRPKQRAGTRGDNSTTADSWRRRSGCSTTRIRSCGRSRRISTQTPLRSSAAVGAQLGIRSLSRRATTSENQRRRKPRKKEQTVQASKPLQRLLRLFDVAAGRQIASRNRMSATPDCRGERGRRRNRRACLGLDASPTISTTDRAIAVAHGHATGVDEQTTPHRRPAVTPACESQHQIRGLELIAPPPVVRCSKEEERRIGRDSGGSSGRGSCR